MGTYQYGHRGIDRSVHTRYSPSFKRMGVCACKYPFCIIDMVDDISNDVENQLREHISSGETTQRIDTDAIRELVCQTV